MKVGVHRLLAHAHSFIDLVLLPLFMFLFVNSYSFKSVGFQYVQVFDR